MRSRWILRSVAVVVIMLTLPVLALAQTSRVEGMAIQGDYIKDYTGLFTYISEVSNVGNLVYGELGNLASAGASPFDRSVGAVLGNIWDGRYGTWAVHMRQFTPNLGQGDVSANPAPGSLGFEVNPNTNAEVSILWQSRSFEHTDTTGVKNEDNGATTYMVAGRAMWQWQPNIVVMPVLKFYSYDLGTRAVAVGGGATATDNSLKGWQAGASGNWTLGTNDLFILGVTFAQNVVEQEVPIFAVPVAGFSPLTNGKITETFAPQTFAALETHVNSWLTLRFGANKGAWRRVKVEDRVNGKTAKVTTSPFSMSIGSGVKLGTLQLDAVLNDSFPQTLGGFFSQQSGYVSFAKVTATYPF